MLSQHIGAPCNALVAKRDKVTAGQKIGDNDSFVCAPVHSPVDGTVKDIALASHPVVGRSMAIFIDVDQDSENNKQPCPDKFGPDFEMNHLSGEQIRDGLEMNDHIDERCQIGENDEGKRPEQGDPD